MSRMGACHIHTETQIAIFIGQVCRLSPRLAASPSATRRELCAGRAQCAAASPTTKDCSEPASARRAATAARVVSRVEAGTVVSRVERCRARGRVASMPTSLPPKRSPHPAHPVLCCGRSPAAACALADPNQRERGGRAAVDPWCRASSCVRCE